MMGAAVCLCILLIPNCLGMSAQSDARHQRLPSVVRLTSNSPPSPDQPYLSSHSSPCALKGSERRTGEAKASNVNISEWHNEYPQEVIIECSTFSRETPRPCQAKWQSGHLQYQGCALPMLVQNGKTYIDRIYDLVSRLRHFVKTIPISMV